MPVPFPTTLRSPRHQPNDKFRAIEDSKPQLVDVHLEEAIEHTKLIGAANAKRKPKPNRKRATE